MRLFDERFQVRLVGFAVAALLASLAMARWIGVPPPVIPTSMMLLLVSLVAACAVTALVVYVLWLAVIEREPKPIPRVRALTARYAAPSYLIERIAPILATLVFLGTLGTFKSLIPFINPFSWDTGLSDFDRLVFGTDAWRWTHAFVGPFGTRIIDALYGLWFAVWAVAVVLYSVFAPHEIQRRFFISFLTLWVIFGVVIATICSSAGPVFLDLIGHPYADRYLIPLDDARFASIARNVLIDAYNAQSAGVGHGISAMPSMHVAVVALLAIAAPKRWRLPAWTYWAVIMFGSVHLGWHYASDGIVGTLGAWMVWRWTRPRTESGPGLLPAASVS